MKILDLFKECDNRKNYTTGKGGLDWKVVNNRLYFEPSDGVIDWVKNFMFIPFPTILSGRLYFIPFGAWLDIKEIRRICAEHDSVLETIGYSRGGWGAVYAALILGITAKTFGCPGLVFMPTMKAQATIDATVVHFENPDDIVCNVPPHYKHGKDRRVTNGTVVQSGGLEWYTGHSPQEYLQRLALLAY